METGMIILIILIIGLILSEVISVTTICRVSKELREVILINDEHRRRIYYLERKLLPSKLESGDRFIHNGKQYVFNSKVFNYILNKEDIYYIELGSTELILGSLYDLESDPTYRCTYISYR